MAGAGRRMVDPLGRAYEYAESLDLWAEVASVHEHAAEYTVLRAPKGRPFFYKKGARRGVWRIHGAHKPGERDLLLEEAVRCRSGPQGPALCLGHGKEVCILGGLEIFAEDATEYILQEILSSSQLPWPMDHPVLEALRNTPCKKRVIGSHIQSKRSQNPECAVEAMTRVVLQKAAILGEGPPDEEVSGLRLHPDYLSLGARAEGVFKRAAESEGYVVYMGKLLGKPICRDVRRALDRLPSLKMHEAERIGELRKYSRIALLYAYAYCASKRREERRPSLLQEIGEIVQAHGAAKPARALTFQKFLSLLSGTPPALLADVPPEILRYIRAGIDLQEALSQVRGALSGQPPGSAGPGAGAPIGEKEEGEIE